MFPDGVGVAAGMVDEGDPPGATDIDELFRLPLPGFVRLLAPPPLLLPYYYRGRILARHDLFNVS